jgi:hypothetical protein
VAAAAKALGLDRWRSALKPQDKIARIEQLKAEGAAPLMVGDGVNDAPALAAAHVSVSMGSAAEISRSAADLVIQGDRLSALPRAFDVARQAKRPGDGEFRFGQYLQYHRRAAGGVRPGHALGGRAVHVGQLHRGDAQRFKIWRA